MVLLFTRWYRFIGFRDILHATGLFFCIGVQCQRWTSIANTNVLNGQLNSANDVQACQQACESNSGCNGVDFTPTSNPSQRCYLHGSWSGQRNVGGRQGTTHYDLDRNCQGIIVKSTVINNSILCIRFQKWLSVCVRRICPPQFSRVGWVQFILWPRDECWSGATTCSCVCCGWAWLCCCAQPVDRLLTVYFDNMSSHRRQGGYVFAFVSVCLSAWQLDNSKIVEKFLVNFFYGGLECVTCNSRLDFRGVKRK